MPRFVLEIGTEEIPPRFFPPALAQLRQDGQAMFERARLAFRKPPTVYGTPRRLVLIAEDLAERQAPHQREERGPAARVAFDKDGNPTKAAQGFASRYRLKPQDLVVRKTDQGEYVYAIIQEPELPAKKALPSLLPGLITGLSFPKTMRWGTGKLRFGRPIRWLLALLDSEVVEFELDGIKSGRLTRGHPALAEGMFEVEEAAGYEEALGERYVIVDPDTRWENLERQVREVAKSASGTPVGITRPSRMPVRELIEKAYWFTLGIETDLSLHTAFLVEWPTAALGKFDQQYLNLPERVLEAEMIHAQSYFPVAKSHAEDDKPRQLLPCFVAVRDGGDNHLNAIVAGWESVLTAKLIDAKYFYEQDRKTKLSDRVEALRGVVFHEKLGTMYDKMERVQAVALDLADQLRLGTERRQWLTRAAYLCKADLVTEMVTELSDLQGEMGAIYAASDGEPEEVTAAIRDHYKPRHGGDDTPDTTIGTFLAIADKIDTITACLAVGIVASGSADPYGLRREGAGFVRCLVDPWRFQDDAVLTARFAEVSTSRLVLKLLQQLRRNVEIATPDEDVRQQATEFVAQRLEIYLRDKGGRYDLVQAALAVGSDKIRDAAKRADALNFAAKSNLDEFLKTVIAATRVINISEGYGNGDVNEALFTEPAEVELWAAHRQVSDRVDDLQGGRGEYDEGLFYRKFLGELALLRKPIDRYFDDVLVMHEDEALRRNRLAMCWQLSQLFRRIADFTLIVQA